MKQRAGKLLVWLAWQTSLLADEGQESSRNAPPKLSGHISAMVRAELPGYMPRVDQPPSTSTESAPAVARDPDILELPKITVREKPPVKIDPLDILILSERKKKLARDFKNSFEGLDAVLNGFSFPIFSPSMAVRGRIYHQQQQLEELNRVARAVRQDDPKASAGLQKDSADAQRALDRQTRPAGDK